MATKKITDPQRVALRYVNAITRTEGPPFPNEVPGGITVVRALVRRELVRLDHSRVLITSKGRVWAANEDASS